MSVCHVAPRSAVETADVVEEGLVTDPASMSSLFTPNHFHQTNERTFPKGLLRYHAKSHCKCAVFFLSQNDGPGVSAGAQDTTHNFGKLKTKGKRMRESTAAPRRRSPQVVEKTNHKGMSETLFISLTGHSNCCSHENSEWHKATDESGPRTHSTRRKLHPSTKSCFS